MIISISSREDQIPYYQVNVYVDNQPFLFINYLFFILQKCIVQPKSLETMYLCDLAEWTNNFISRRNRLVIFFGTFHLKLIWTFQSFGKGPDEQYLPKHSNINSVLLPPRSHSQAPRPGSHIHLFPRQMLARSSLIPRCPHTAPSLFSLFHHTINFL